MKIKMHLSIGYANCAHEEVIDIPDEEFEDCYTEEQRQYVMNERWSDWAAKYICGGAIQVSEND